MALINKTIAGQYGGVSQQTYNLRNETQSEEQINNINSLVDGVYKRHKSSTIKKIFDFNNDYDNFHYLIDKNNIEQYFLQINKTGNIKIFDKKGFKFTVVGYETGGYNIERDYLTTNNPFEDLRAITIADTTIIVNNKKKVLKKEITTTTSIKEAFVYIKTGVASQKYIVRIDGSTFTYTTGGTSEFNTYRTDVIATELSSVIIATLTDFTTQVNGNVIRIYRLDGEDFLFSATDSWGDNAILGFKETISNESLLPANFFDNTIIEISGNKNIKQDNYYVIYKNNKWSEYRKKDIVHEFDFRTTPIKLLRMNDIAYVDPINNPNGIYFTLLFIDFNERLVGDEIVAPFPSFIDNYINNIVFFENRICFFSNNNISFSRSGDYYNFFPTTSTEVLDDDPIDLTLPTADGSNILYGIPFNNSMILFTNKQQFMVSSNQGILTPSSINIDPTTNFYLDYLSKPLPLGTNLYFINNKGKYSSLREYYVDQNTLTNDASDVSSHVPNYINKNIIKIVGSTDSDTIILLSKENRKELYIYKYYWNGEQKLQSSWSKWRFDNEIINMDILENKLYLQVKNNSEVILSVINLEREFFEDNNFDVCLDLFSNIGNGYYSELFKDTTYDLPFKIEDIEDFKDNYVLIDSKGFDMLNSLILVEIDNINNKLKLKNDTTLKGTLFIGKKYNFIHKFSRFNIKAQGTTVAEVEGRIQLSKITISYNNSLYFDLFVKPIGREISKKSFTNIKTGISLLGNNKAVNGDFKAYIMTNSDNEGIWIENNTYFPNGFQTISWEAQYAKRSQSV